MRLIELAEIGVEPALANLDITGLSADSRAVKPGYLFAALPGRRDDGRAYVTDALARGAVAILGTPALARDMPGLPVLADENPRRRLALLAARFYGRQPELVAAVTGTNGKTSTVAFARQLWAALGRKAASLGTLGVVSPGYRADEGLTTPEPVALHATLARLAGEGVDRLAMEASSHGLDQFRLDGVRTRVAAFTNLTRDHLDYHGTFEAYRAAKARLFTELLPQDGVAVINADSPEALFYMDAATRRALRVIDYGRAAKALTLLDTEPTAEGQRLSLVWQGKRRDVRLPLVAAFQAQNALCAAGIVLAADENADAVFAALERLEAVPGRVQRAAVLPNGASVYVDYAHTPDALETALRALRPHAAKRLHVLFGCGGDRDAGKRPMMGEIAARLADVVIVTDDNPRSEDPGAIRRQIMAAAPGAREIGDRAEAIRQAVAALQPGDLLVLAGKGHERTQTIGSRVIPFDDVTHAAEAAKRLGGGG